MAKRKSGNKKTSPDAQMIHFRPGAELGGLIGKFSKQLSILRGEVAKRFTSLAIHGFDIGFYGYANELSEYMYATFDEAVGQLHVAVVQEYDDQSDVAEIPRDDKIQVVERWLESYSSIHQLDQEAEQRKVKIQVFLTE